MTLLLASASPRRRELLARVGIEVQVLAAEVDEAVLPAEAVLDYARRVAGAKAAAIAARHPRRWVLAADTVVEVGGAILGKPANVDAARSMLTRLVATRHRVTTAFCLRRGDDATVEVVTTEVVMRAASADELEDYLAAGEWRGKAGGYAVQGMAAALITEVRGSITNVIGLPLAEVLAALRARDIARPCYQQGVPA